MKKTTVNNSPASETQEADRPSTITSAPLSLGEQRLMLVNGFLTDDVRAYDAWVFKDPQARTAHAVEYTVHLIRRDRDLIVNCWDYRGVLTANEVYIGLELNDADRKIVGEKEIAAALGDVLGLPSFMVDGETYYALGFVEDTDVGDPAYEAEKQAFQAKKQAYQEDVDNARESVLRFLVGGLSALKAKIGEIEAA